MSGTSLQNELPAAMVHDLRTAISILRARMDTFGDQRAMHQFRDDLARLNQILELLLDVSRIPQSPERDVADLRQVCERLVDHFALPAMLQGKSISLVLRDEITMTVPQNGLLFLALRNIVAHLLRRCDEWAGVEVQVARDAVKLFVSPEPPSGETGTRKKEESDYGLVFAERTLAELGGTLAPLWQHGEAAGYQVTIGRDAGGK